MYEEHDHRPFSLLSSWFPLSFLLPLVLIWFASVAGRHHEEESQPKFTALLVEALRLSGLKKHLQERFLGLRDKFGFEEISQFFFFYLPRIR